MFLKKSLVMAETISALPALIPRKARLGFQRINPVSEQPAKLQREKEGPASREYEAVRPRFGAEAIKAGLEWLLTTNRDEHWTDCAAFGCTADPWVTSCVLARLGELPDAYISHSLRQQIGRSLDWLERARIAESGWCGPSGEPDAFTTSWAILALRAHRRSVPRSSLDFISRCRQTKGGFSAYPQESAGNQGDVTSSPEVTATVLRVVDMPDSAAAGFVASRLESELPAAALGRTSRLYVCSEVLDWESGLAPWSLLNRISRCIAPLGVEEPYEQALVLRSLLRLRNQKAWAVAAALRAMQCGDGSWPACAVLFPAGRPAVANGSCFGDTRTIATATAVSALAMNESQPGLYFGSDLPRRFRDC